MEKAIAALSNDNAPRSDAIPAEIFKTGGTRLAIKIDEQFETIWSAEGVPREFKDASIVHFYKNKGHRQRCDKHRGISLRSIAGKILARVLPNRLLVHIEQGLLPESQCGFRKGRGTTDMILCSTITTGEMPRTTTPSIHSIC